MQSIFQKITASFKKWTGKVINKDKQYANQCTDWTKQYAEDIGYPITTYGNAKDFIKKGLGPNWTLVKGEAWVGDIIIFPSGKYGHIAVFQNESNGIIQVMEQNRDGNAYKNNDPKNLGSPVSIGKWKKVGNEVYFRAKPQ